MVLVWQSFFQVKRCSMKKVAFPLSLPLFIEESLECLSLRLLRPKQMSGSGPLEQRYSF